MRAGLAILFLAVPVLAQDAEELSRRFLAQEREAFEHYNRKDWPAAVAAFERQAAIYADNPRPYYNIACCYALDGDAERAGTWILLAIARGFRDADHLASDTDFDRVRQSPEYIACLAKMKRARELDPDPMPGTIPPGSVPPAPSVSVAMAASRLQEEAVRGMAVLLDTHRFRKTLFAILDRRMAVLARYIIENGDAFDAADAATERLRTAALYLQEAEGPGEPDRALREAGAEAVLRTVEEFLRGYPGDPRLPHVLLARAVALQSLGRGDEAIPLLRTIHADHAEQARLADLQLCALLPPGDELKQAYGRLKGDPALRSRLLRARLLCDGMPNLLDLDEAAAARVTPHRGLVGYVFVACGDSESERLLAELPAANDRWLPVVVNVGTGVADPERWLAEHGRSFPTIVRGADAIERAGIETVPLVVVARSDGTVVAVDPDAAEITRLTGR